MRIIDMRISHFKSIKEMHIKDIENALILVGQNNTGKTTILDAVRAVGGVYQMKPEDYDRDGANIENGIISKYRRMEAWKKEFCKKLPSYYDGVLHFVFIANRDGKVRYDDGYHKNNPYIKEVFPKIYYVDAERNLTQLQNDILLLQEDALLKKMRTDCCLFEQAKKCNHCFSCIGPQFPQKWRSGIYFVFYEPKCGEYADRDDRDSAPFTASDKTFG